MSADSSFGDQAALLFAGRDVAAFADLVVAAFADLDVAAFADQDTVTYAALNVDSCADGASVVHVVEVTGLTVAPAVVRLTSLAAHIHSVDLQRPQV